MAPVVIKNFQLSSYKRPSIAPALSPVEKVEMFADLSINYKAPFWELFF